MNNMDAFHRLHNQTNDIHRKEEEDFILRKTAMKRSIRDMLIDHGKCGAIRSIHLVPHSNQGQPVFNESEASWHWQWLLLCSH